MMSDFRRGWGVKNDPPKSDIIYVLMFPKHIINGRFSFDLMLSQKFLLSFASSKHVTREFLIKFWDHVCTMYAMVHFM